MNFLKTPVCLVVVVLFSAAGQLAAGPGSLDPGFSKDGYTIAGGTNGNSHMAVMKDGRIVVASNREREDEWYGYHNDILISRHQVNGAYDGSFDGGAINIDLRGGYNDDGDYDEDAGSYYDDQKSSDQVTAIAVQPDGKILVAGNAYYDSDYPYSYSFLIRVNVDGSFDSSFGKKGMVTWQEDGSARSIIVLSGGKILLGGNHVSYPDPYGVKVTRLNSDGSEDATFLGNGDNFRPGNLDYSSFADMAVQQDGKIVVVGSSYNDDFDDGPVQQDSFVMRLTADGTLDTTFDGDGYRETPTPKLDHPSSVVILPEGKILVGGTIELNPDDATDSRMIEASITRFTSSGTLDTTFSGDGITTYPVGVSTVARMLVQKDGKVVFVGTIRIGTGNSDIGLVRFLPTGSLDTGFGSGGVALADFGWEDLGEDIYSSLDSAHTAALLPDGKVLVLGENAMDGILARFSMVIQTDAMVGVKTSGMSGNNIYNSSGAGQTVGLSIKRASGKKTSSKTAYVRIQNDGATTQPFLIQGVASDKFFIVKYLNGKTDVTKQVTAGTFRTGSLVPGATHLLKVVISAKTTAKKKSRNFFVTARASTDLGSWDVVLVKATSK